jgi:hypothetical protein
MITHYVRFCPHYLFILPIGSVHGTRSRERHGTDGRHASQVRFESFVEIAPEWVWIDLKVRIRVAYVAKSVSTALR